MVEASHIRKCYGKRRILDDISFQAKCGESVVIVGRNGCGKTTLMQILAGVDCFEEGSLCYFENVMRNGDRKFRTFCGYVPQNLPLLEELTVKDNLKLWGVIASPQYEKIKDSFQLEEILKMEVRKLSGGMKRRLAIACALAEWPPILLMDEPTTALDLHYKQLIQLWIEEYKKMNGIVIFTSHDEKEIMGADRCLLMQDGKLTELPKEKKKIEYIKEQMLQ